MNRKSRKAQQKKDFRIKTEDESIKEEVVAMEDEIEDKNVYLNWPQEDFPSNFVDFEEDVKPRELTQDIEVKEEKFDAEEFQSNIEPIMASEEEASSSKEDVARVTVFKSKSIVWKLFKVDEKDQTKAICELCDNQLSRGSKTANFTTSNMLKHLSTKHNKELKEEQEKEKVEQEKKRKLQTNQTYMSNISVKKKLKAPIPPTLYEILNKKKKWDINDHRAKRIHQLIGEMIAVDLQPLSILEDIGFQRLMNHTCPNYQIPSRKFVKENIVQDIYTSVKNKIQEEINLAMYISFTSDGWSASTGNNSFLSLTAHWINSNYEQKTAVLGVTPFDVSHTAVNISECLQNTMMKYQIVDSKVHLIVRDNAANMTAGVTQAGYESLGCFMHTLQLVLKDAIFEQRYVKDIVATCKQIVGHFNHSSSAFAKYTNYQIKFNIPEHRLIQDVDTRWNSQYYMLARIFEQKTALIAYCSDHSKPSCLGTDQWKLLEKLQQILKHFVDCTNFLSADNAIASAIIPNMKVICHFFDKGEAKGLFAGLGSTLSAWKASVRNRFGSYFNDKNLILATYLDPRFKTTFLEDEYGGKDLRDILQQWMTEDICLNVSHISTCEVADSSDMPGSADNKSDEDDENAFNFSFDSCFAEFKKKSKEKKQGNKLQTQKNSQENSLFIKTGNFLEVEMARYEELVPIKNEDNSLQWWAANKDSFPNMSILVKKYLCAPPSSIQSERLSKRNRIKSETGEMLMFLHYNLRMMSFKYC